MTRNAPPAAEVLGRNVRTRREALGLSQGELALAAEIEEAAISRIENGRTGERGIGLARIERLARALKTTPSQLLHAS